MADHPSGMFARSVLASRSSVSGIALHSLHIRFPRYLLPEFNTHRVFSRNVRSSRAVPVKTMLFEVRNDPIIPWHWFKNQPGMQGKIPLSDAEREEAIRLWLEPLPHVIEAVEKMRDPEGLDIHKQVPNRLLEAWAWTDVLVSSTDWANFLWLRDHEDAEPHIRDLAVLIREELESAEVQELKPGEWHLPYITEEDWEKADRFLRQGRNIRSLPTEREVIDVLRKISAARCARISYKPFDGDASFDRELERYSKLTGNGAVHASPFEHIATPVALVRPLGNFRGFRQFRHEIEGNTVHD